MSRKIGPLSIDDGGGFLTDDQRPYCYISSCHNTTEKRKNERIEEGRNKERKMTKK
jgi:hypothetical protein